MISLRRFRGTPVAPSGAQPVRPRRLQDSRARRRWRSRVGVGLMVVGLGCLVFGVATNRAPSPTPVRIASEGTTTIPGTHFYQSQWVLFGQVDDPRRVPSPEEVGCLPVRGISLPEQPLDLTRFGSRVVEGRSIAALMVLSRSETGAQLRCRGAVEHAPLWLMPSSEAPPFTSTGLAILGFMLLVAGALTHPATADLPHRWRSARSEDSAG